MKRNPAWRENADNGFRPFEHLRDLLDGHSLKKHPAEPFSTPPPRSTAPPAGEGEKTERQLFMDAMADVRPISGANRHTLARNKAGQPAKSDTGETGVMDHLRRLVACGHGFEVCHTPEYMEGRGYNVGREVTRRLYNGDFSIQDHIDLHGLSAADAREAFSAFMASAIAAGKRGVLIVHGRGLSSPAAPVLKSQVLSWLTRSAIRKWVLAFTSARNCDGGAGATYVLLRLRPVTKRFRKGRREKRNEGRARHAVC
ncbi:Smr/MutS family protein [Desulfococcus sp.]|uniref:Smr/MutS family protein n=1 Tax=Desulfococcus sp. TaxID=2025834 RepID=UPI0035941E23